MPRVATPAARTSRLAANVTAARKVTAAVNATRKAGEPSAQAGELAALELLHEIFHLVVEKAAELVPATAMDETTAAVEQALGPAVATGVLDAVGGEFPDVEDRPTPVRLEELLLIRVANENPAARPLRALVDDAPLLTQGARRGRGGGRGVRGDAAADRAERRDARRAPARAGARPPDLARRAAALRPRQLGRPAGRRPRRRCSPGCCSRST